MSKQRAWTTRRRDRQSKPRPKRLATTTKTVKRRKREPGDPNEWFASLRAFAAADFASRSSLPDVSECEILSWADAHHARNGEWPMHASGPIPESPGESWMAVEAALRMGLRGLPGLSTLARSLAEHRGRRHQHFLIRLSIPLILEWADAHFERTGDWPHSDSGPIEESPGDNWGMICIAMTTGFRGLERGLSLAQLLAESRGVRNKMGLPTYTIEGILAWADLHHGRTGKWPKRTSGSIADSPGES